MKTNVGEQVLDLILSYIHNVEDRNSVSLLSRKFYELDGVMRKSLTVHTLYYPNPASLSNRFPYVESLTLRGPPTCFNVTDDYDIRIRPWIEQLALKFRCLKELHIRGLAVHNEDLETLARTRGKDLRSLKIHKCEEFSTDGLRHLSKYCNQLRTFSLRNSYDMDVKDGIWLHQFALNSTVLEKFHVRTMYIPNAEDLTLLAKNCCNSLISLKIEKCYLSKLRDVFRYAVRLEHFAGNNWDEKSELVGFRFPLNMHSLSIKDLPVIQYSRVLPPLNHIRKLKLAFLELDSKCSCLLLESCPNLEVLYTEDVCGDKGLQVIGEFCKKLRKLTHNGLVSHIGLIALAKGCTKLECLKVRLGDVSNETIEFVGTRLKNLRKLHMNLFKINGTTNLPLDNAIMAMLMGCNKLEKLDISLWHGRLTDVGLEYIGKYGSNLRSLSLTRIGNSDAGLVRLSQGCPNLRKLKLMDCPFSEQVVTSIVFDMPSLRYVYVRFESYDRTDLALIRPEVQLETLKNHCHLEEYTEQSNTPLSKSLGKLVRAGLDLQKLESNL